MKWTFFSLIMLFFLLPTIVLAGQKEVIFSYDFLTSQEYRNSANQWQIFNNFDEGLYAQAEGMLLKNDGDAYIVYSKQFNYKDFDKLKIIYSSNKPTGINIIPNVLTTGFSTYELRKQFDASDELQEVEFSLRLPFFKDTIEDLGINFYTKEPAEIIIAEISLEKSDFSDLTIQAVKDYWQVFPYSPFTVNLFATPRVFGYSASIYFLPILLVAFWLALKSRRRLKIGIIILLAFWVLLDVRMSYEFLNYHLTDYKNYVAPAVEEKSLRTYQDFYQFGDWVNQNVPTEQERINFYSFGSVHFPGVLRYLVYPHQVRNEGVSANTFLIYNRTDIVYNPDEKRLYIGDRPLTEAGNVIANYNKNSFIFIEQ